MNQDEIGGKCETQNVFYLIVIHRIIFIEYLSKTFSGYNVYTLRFSIGKQSCCNDYSNNGLKFSIHLHAQVHEIGCICLKRAKKAVTCCFFINKPQYIFYIMFVHCFKSDVKIAVDV